MKNLKSSMAFDNLKPSEEQKKIIYNRLMSDIVKLNDDVIVQNNSVEIVQRKKTSIKSVLYPSLAAAILIAVFAAALPNLRNNEPNTGISNSSGASGTEISSEDQTDRVVFDSRKSYNAEVINENDNYIFLIGSHDGNVYYSKGNAEWETTYRELSESSPSKKIINEKGKEVIWISDAVSEDKTYICVTDGEENASVCVYNNDLTEIIFSLFDDGDIVCSHIAKAQDRDFIYGVCCDKGTGKNYKIQKRDLNDKIISQADMTEYNVIDDIMVMGSGDIAVLCRYDNKTVICIYDSDLNYKMSVSRREIGGNMAYLTGFDDELYVVTSTRQSIKTDDKSFSVENKINIYSVDFENQTLTLQSSEIPEFIYGSEELMNSYGAYIYKGSNGYDFFYIDEKSTLYGYRIKDNISEKVAENVDVSAVFNVGDKLYGIEYQTIFSLGITSPTNDENTIFESPLYPITTFNTDIKIYSDGHISEWFNSDSENDYIINYIDPDSGTYETTEFRSDENVSECLVKDDYIVAVCSTPDYSCCDIINIYNKDGILLKKIKPDKGYINDLFLTAENKLIAFLYDEEADEFSGAEVDIETGKMNSIQVSWLKFLQSWAHVTGSDGYSAFFILNDGIYGSVYKDSDYTCEKIIDFSKVNFPEGCDRDFDKFAYDRYGYIYLQAYDSRIYRLSES